MFTKLLSIYLEIEDEYDTSSKKEKQNKTTTKQKTNSLVMEITKQVKSSSMNLAGILET